MIREKHGGAGVLPPLKFSRPHRRRGIGGLGAPAVRVMQVVKGSTPRRAQASPAKSHDAIPGSKQKELAQYREDVPSPA
jgi:hypothetical protein